MQTLGALGADVRNLAESVAHNGRVSDSIKHDLTGLTGRLDVLSTDVSVIKPAIAKFEETYQRSIGARALVRAMWGALVALIGAASVYIVHYLKGAQ